MEVSLRDDAGAAIPPLVSRVYSNGSDSPQPRRRTEQWFSYDDPLLLNDAPPLSDLTRVRLTYKALNPAGAPLLQDATHQWTDIPWITEVSLVYAPPVPLRFLHWREY